MSGEDKRLATRYSYQCQVIVATGDRSCLTQLENLSESGCCIQKPIDWNFSPNDVLKLYIVIDGSHIIDTEAKQVWRGANHIGLQYLQPQSVPIQLLDEV